jgi:hypothetical protein
MEHNPQSSESKFLWKKILCREKQKRAGTGDK